MSLFDLSGKVAIVTGGNGGIGLGMAKGLAAAGAAIAIAGRDADKSAVAVEALGALGAEAIAIDHEATEEASCRALVARTVEGLGRVDILVNNAGTTIRKRPEDLTLGDWRHVLDTNLTSAFMCASAAYPEMVKAGGGKVINIGSMMSIFGATVAAAYGASKGGLVQLTRSLAVAWAGDDIQANAILPGWVDTGLAREGRAEIPGRHERVLARTPAGRWGTPEDFAGIATFLAAPASDFITGAAIPVDGGYATPG